MSKEGINKKSECGGCATGGSALQQDKSRQTGAVIGGTRMQSEAEKWTGKALASLSLQLQRILVRRLRAGQSFCRRAASVPPLEQSTAVRAGSEVMRRQWDWSAGGAMM